MKTLLTTLLITVGAAAALAEKPGRNSRRGSATPHEGVCIRNDGAPPLEGSKYQFICYSQQNTFAVRCDLSGEGGNIVVGTWTRFGANEGISFDGSENHGNSGFNVCTRESKH